MIFVAGALVGIAYGVGAGTIRSDADVIAAMSKSMATLASYLVLVFFAAQFVALFDWTQIGLILGSRAPARSSRSRLPKIPLLVASSCSRPWPTWSWARLRRSRR